MLQSLNPRCRQCHYKSYLTVIISFASIHHWPRGLSLNISLQYVSGDGPNLCMHTCVSLTDSIFLQQGFLSASEHSESPSTSHSQLVSVWENVYVCESKSVNFVFPLLLKYLFELPENSLRCFLFPVIPRYACMSDMHSYTVLGWRKSWMTCAGQCSLVENFK